MQFIFGNDRTSYNLMYVEGDKQEASRVRELISFSFDPNMSHDVLGYIPYGSNANSALFFNVKKDESLGGRGVYYMHGMFRPLTQEAAFGNFFFDGICAKFINQQEFDLLRDGKATAQSLNLGKMVEVCRGYSINRNVLKVIISNLYQKKKVLLVIDDNKYEDKYVRFILKEIYRFLTPSLRKSCSYITAMHEPANMPFQLRIIPRSLLLPEESYIDIDNKEVANSKPTIFDEAADFMLGKMENDLMSFFKSYEFLFSGWKSMYKTQFFEDYYKIIAYKDDALLVKSFDKLLATSDITRETMLPADIANRMRNIFSSDKPFEEGIVIDEQLVLNPEELIKQNNLYIYKVCLFTDAAGINKLGKYMLRTFGNVVVHTEDVRIENAIKKASEYAKNEQSKWYEKEFFNRIVGEGYRLLYERQRICDSLFDEACTVVEYIINQRAIIDRKQIPNVINEALSKSNGGGSLAVTLKENNIDIFNELKMMADAEVEKQILAKREMEAEESEKNEEEFIKRLAADVDMKRYNMGALISALPLLSKYEGYLCNVYAKFCYKCVTSNSKYSFRFVDELFVNMVREGYPQYIINIGNIIAEDYPILAILFFFKYCSNIKIVIDKVNEILSMHAGNINQLEKNYLTETFLPIETYMRENGAVSNIDNSIIELLDNMILNAPKKDKSHVVLSCIKDAVNKCLGKKNNKKFIMIISSAIAVVAIIAALLFILNPFGDDKKDSDKNANTMQATDAPPTPSPTGDTNSGNKENIVYLDISKLDDAEPFSQEENSPIVLRFEADGDNSIHYIGELDLSKYSKMIIKYANDEDAENIGKLILRSDTSDGDDGNLEFDVELELTKNYNDRKTVEFDLSEYNHSGEMILEMMDSESGVVVFEIALVEVVKIDADNNATPGPTDNLSNELETTVTIVPTQPVTAPGDNDGGTDGEIDRENDEDNNSETGEDNNGETAGNNNSETGEDNNGENAGNIGNETGEDNNGENAGNIGNENGEDNNDETAGDNNSETGEDNNGETAGNIGNENGEDNNSETAVDNDNETGEDNNDETAVDNDNETGEDNNDETADEDNNSETAGNETAVNF